MSKIKSVPSKQEPETSKVPSLSSQTHSQSFWKSLDRRLPKNLVVTIDGPARVGKNTTGELLALAMNGVVVDSGRFYRTLTLAAIVAGIDLDNTEAVEEYCAGVRLDAVVRLNERNIFEALPTVDGALYASASLVSVAAQTPQVARLTLVRALVNALLRRLCRLGRMVVLGRDMGTLVFPTTPFKFFLNAPASVRELRDSGKADSRSVADRDRLDAQQTHIPDGAAIIDTGSKNTEEVLVSVLDELIRRSMPPKDNQA